MSGFHWTDQWTAEELACGLDDLANEAAWRNGRFDDAATLANAATALRELDAESVRLRTEMGYLKNVGHAKIRVTGVEDLMPPEEVGGDE